MAGSVHASNQGVFALRQTNGTYLTYLTLPHASKEKERDTTSMHACRDVHGAQQNNTFEST